MRTSTTFEPPTRPDTAPGLSVTACNKLETLVVGGKHRSILLPKYVGSWTVEFNEAVLYGPYTVRSQRSNCF